MSKFIANSIIIILWPVFAVISASEIHNEKLWQVTSNSMMVIKGTTNVNEYTCLSVSYSGEDVMTERHFNENKEGEINGKVVMQATGFECDNDIMTRDFKRTLNADEFPDIEVRFINLQNKYATNNKRLRGEIEITLAGVTRKYLLFYYIETLDDNTKILTGNRSFRFSDFDLKAPQKFFGMISVDDQVSVDFHLKLESI